MEEGKCLRNVILPLRDAGTQTGTNTRSGGQRGDVIDGRIAHQGKRTLQPRDGEVSIKQRRLTLLLLAAACIAQGQARSNPSDGMDPRIAHGRYIATIGGCNDGHTARFAESGGNVPESDWFTGSARLLRPMGYHLRQQPAYRDRQHDAGKLEELRAAGEATAADAVLGVEAR